MKITFHIKILFSTLNIKGLGFFLRLKVFLILVRKLFRLAFMKVYRYEN